MDKGGEWRDPTLSSQKCNVCKSYGKPSHPESPLTFHVFVRKPQGWVLSSRDRKPRKHKTALLHSSAGTYDTSRCLRITMAIYAGGPEVTVKNSKTKTKGKNTCFAIKNNLSLGKSLFSESMSLPTKAERCSKTCIFLQICASISDVTIQNY